MTQIADVSVLNPQGEIDSQEGKLLLDRIGQLLRNKWKKVVLDFGNVEHVHYRVFSELTRASLVYALQSGAIKIANLNSYTKQILKFAGADPFFETYDSVADAVLSFSETGLDSCLYQ